VAATMYKWDDLRPYLYKTTDYGKTWKKIVDGIPDSAFTRVIREDPNRKGILYAGTETGIYISFNDGDRWQSLQLNLPVVPITDIAIHKREKNLIAATQGRSFWVLDDLAVLHQMSDETAKAELYLYKPEDAYRMNGFGGPLPPRATVGENPPNGAVIFYYLKDKPKGEVTIEFLDAGGKSIKKFSSRSEENKDKPPEPGGEDEFSPARLTKVLEEPGLNKFVWDLRYAEAAKFPGLIMWAGDTRGPRVVPGTYQVKLTVDGKTLTQSFELKKDPRIRTTLEELVKQYDLL